MVKNMIDSLCLLFDCLS